MFYGKEYIMSHILITVLIVVIAVLLFLSVIVFHEFGHFIFAKLFGVKVNEFAVGMGPKLLSKQGKETLYTVRLFPIGGYCAMEGEDEESDDERAFNNKKVWKKMIIVVAGAVFNIILGLVFMFIITVQEPYYTSNEISYSLAQVSKSDVALLSDTDIGLYTKSGADGSVRYFCINGTEISKQLHDEKISQSDTLSDMFYTETDESGNVHYYCGRPFEKNDLQPGDEILSVNGYRALCFDDAYFAMSLDDDGVMDMEILRDGKKVEIQKSFVRVPTEYEGIYQTILDFYVQPLDKSFGTVMEQTWYESLYFVRSVYVSLFRLVTGQSGFNELSGPVGIASVIGEAAEIGFAESFMSGINNILYIMALISFNLGIVNLLPLPALDGGRLIFLIIEAVRGKPVDPKYEGIIHFVGLLLFFALTIVITFNDISKLVSGCVGG